MLLLCFFLSVGEGKGEGEVRYQSRVKVVYHVSPVLPSRQFDVSMPFLRKHSTLPLAPQPTVTPSQSVSRQVSKHAAIDIGPCESESTNGSQLGFRARGRLMRAFGTVVAPWSTFQTLNRLYRGVLPCRVL